jgi:hypothetical protein
MGTSRLIAYPYADREIDLRDRLVDATRADAWLGGLHLYPSSAME